MPSSITAESRDTSGSNGASVFDGPPRASRRLSLAAQGRSGIEAQRFVHGVEDLLRLARLRQHVRTPHDDASALACGALYVAV
jgi:hypothetical protein